MANEMILIGKVRMMDKDSRTVRFKVSEPKGCSDMSLTYNRSSVILEEKLTHAFQDETEVLLTVNAGWINRLRHISTQEDERTDGDV